MVLCLDVKDGRWLQCRQQDSPLNFRLGNVMVHSGSEIRVGSKHTALGLAVYHVSIPDEYRYDRRRSSSFVTRESTAYSMPRRAEIHADDVSALNEQV